MHFDKIDFAISCFDFLFHPSFYYVIFALIVKLCDVKVTKSGKGTKDSKLMINVDNLSELTGNTQLV